MANKRESPALAPDPGPYTPGRKGNGHRRETVRRRKYPFLDKVLAFCACMKPFMEPYLIKPKGRSRKRAMMLPILLGLTVLLYLLVLMPIRDVEGTDPQQTSE